MLPLIREGIDSVILSPLTEKIMPGDVILYKRDSGQFVLHRVMHVSGDQYTMCGDNQVVFEKGILRKHMIALVTGIIRDNQEIIFAENNKYLSYTRKTLSKKKRANFLNSLKRLRLKKLIKFINS